MVNRVGNHLRQSATEVRWFEDVLEDAFDIYPRTFVRMNAECAEAKVERANVVEAEDVIGVTVGDQNGVETFESEAQRLLAKIGGGIDEDGLARVFDDHRNAQTFVARIVRGTGLTLATNRRHAGRRSCTEESES